MAGSFVSVVDDDESVRESLPRLVKAFGYSVHACSSPEEFLASGRASQTGCLILDVAMPGMSGPELQSELNSGNWRFRLSLSPREETRWYAHPLSNEEQLNACLSRLALKLCWMHSKLRFGSEGRLRFQSDLWRVKSPLLVHLTMA
jgi:hypothetical protein